MGAAAPPSQFSFVTEAETSQRVLAAMGGVLFFICILYYSQFVNEFLLVAGCEWNRQVLTCTMGEGKQQGIRLQDAMSSSKALTHWCHVSHERAAK